MTISWSSNSILMKFFLLCSSPRHLQNKKKFIRIGPIDREIIVKMLTKLDFKYGIQEKIIFSIISRSIGPIPMNFFLFCRGRGELHNKKIYIEIELLDHEIVTKNDLFYFPQIWIVIFTGCYMDHKLNIITLYFYY